LFCYFPNNYTWSSAVMLCLMAGGQLGQIDRWLASLRNDAPDVDAWAAAWDNAAPDQVEHAKQDLRQGFRRSASARYLRASTYYLTGERQTPRSDEKPQLRGGAAGLRHREPLLRAPDRAGRDRLPRRGPASRKSSTASSARSSPIAASPAWSSTPPAPMNRCGCHSSTTICSTGRPTSSAAVPRCTPAATQRLGCSFRSSDERLTYRTFVQEDGPDEISATIADFIYVCRQASPNHSFTDRPRQR
jgi:hypothetical protein